MTDSATAQVHPSDRPPVIPAAVPPVVAAIEPGDPPTEMVVKSTDLRAIRRSLGGLFLIAILISLYLARDVLLPIVLALLLTLVLRPLVGRMGRIGIPAGAAAVIVIVAIGVIFGLIAYFSSGPLTELIARAPEIGEDLRFKLRDVLSRVEQLQEVAESAGGGDLESNFNLAGVVTSVAASLAGAGSSILIALFLALFLLASGDLFHRRIVEVSPRMTDKKRSLGIVRDVERQVSRYLAAITIINAGLGFAIGVGLWIMGMPMPYVWGVAAFFLNFLPYIGGLIGTTMLAAVALVTFDSAGYAMLAPAIYITSNWVEGNVATPLFVGRRLELNTVSVFVTVIFWVWLWGVAGAFLAVPLLVVMKVISDSIESMQPFGRFLSGAD